LPKIIRGGLLPTRIHERTNAGFRDSSDTIRCRVTFEFALRQPGGLVMIAVSARRRYFGATASSGLFLAVLASLIAIGTGPIEARADEILLRGGGQVQGKVQPDPQNKDRVQVWLLQGRKPLSFARAQIVEVIPKPSPLDEYFERAKKVPETVAAQFELGTWCEQNKLPDLAKLHFEAALLVDKSFEPAHRKLGHVYHDGYWLSRDDLSAIQGLVKYKGRWITTEERTKRQAEEELTATQATWVRRIKILRQSIVNGPEDRRREAETQLMAIRDSQAVSPLLRVLGNDEPPLRILLAQILAAIPGKEATAGLVKQILAEPSTEVRPVIFEKLKDRDDPNVIPQLVRALTSADLQVINRAAWTLGNLGAIEVVPKLIPALLTQEQRMVMVARDGSNSPAIGTPGVSMVPLRYNNNDIALQTPPVISEGAVAHGVISAPFYAFPYGVGFNPGAQINNTPEPRLFTFTFRNVEVLAALQKMTGQDFGYDIESWRKWVSHDFNPAPAKARRVVQP
jgi:HEAT repeats